MSQGVERFLNSEGQLEAWPSKHADKQLTLEYLVTKFSKSQTYTEQEVNDILKAWHTFSDWPLLRRSLVDSGFLSRDRSGYAYQRVK